MEGSRSLTFQVVSFSATANPVLRLGLLDAASGAVVQRARLDVGVLWCAVLCCMRCPHAKMRSNSACFGRRGVVAHHNTLNAVAMPHTICVAKNKKTVTSAKAGVRLKTCACDAVAKVRKWSGGGATARGCLQRDAAPKQTRLELESGVDRPSSLKMAIEQDEVELGLHARHAHRSGGRRCRQLRGTDRTARQVLVSRLVCPYHTFARAIR
jgi:hypothetical protein